MHTSTLSTDEFRKLLPKICDEETSFHGAGWTRDNPLYAHCAVVSVVAQDVFGGELLRASLEPYPEFAHMRSHYWNRLPDGSEIDFTEQQFFGRRPPLVGEVRKRSEMLSSKASGIVQRYQLLALRLAKMRTGNNQLFDDPIYQMCFFSALDSPCQKMKFGCVVTHRGVVVYRGANKMIPELCSLCEPACMRLSIASRTESMLGACGHAEEWAIWDIVKEGRIPLHRCELYVAGFFPDGFPWIKKSPEHTCLRCAVQMDFARLKKVFVPVIDSWRAMSTSEALTTARMYAMKEKAV